MTAITTTTTAIKSRPSRDGFVADFPVAASTAIPIGAFVNINASGYAVNATDAAALECAGVALQTVDNSSGANGAESITVAWGDQVKVATESDFGQAAIGSAVYVKDNNRVGLAADVTNHCLVGTLVGYISSSLAWVKPTGLIALDNSVVLTARSEDFNLDNGAGATIDRVILRPSAAVTIRAARIVYTDATSGTVAAGNAKIGTTVAGAEIVAATAYENAKAVGTATAMTIVSGAVAANTPVIVRHTGVAATAAGFAHVEIEYTIN